MTTQQEFLQTALSAVIQLASDKQRDIFLCHAHVDKESYVRPLAVALAEYGVSCWLDEAEIRVGDHITERVNAGLQESRFVVVFITPSFLQRNWPRAELNAAFGMEARKGEVVVLPVLALPVEEWLSRFPLFADKLFLSWSEGVEAIARRIAERVGSIFREDWLHHYPAEYEGRIWIRILTLGSKRGTRHTVTLRWGPWRAKKNFNAKRPAVCLVQAKAADEFSIPLFLRVSPPGSVSFGMGPAPCNETLDISHRWRRVQL